LFELFLNGSATRTSFLQVSGDDLDNWFADRDANNLSLSHPGGESTTSATVRMSMRVDGGSVTSVNDSNEALVLNASLTALGQSSGVAGRELHKFDGTATTLVKDIVPAGSSDPVELTESGGKLFFTANDPLGSGRELWVSDGTTEGTMLVEDIRSGFDLYGAPLDGNPRDLTNVNGTLFFSVVDENNDREVWTSDGMPGGTNLLKNIHVGTQDANVQQPVQVGSKLFFVADDGINGEAVWVVDLNSADPPKIAADVTASSSDRVNGLAKFGNGVIFHNDSLGIYKADGVNDPVALLDATPIEFNDQGDLFLEVGTLAYFVRSTAANGEELWKTDGTPGGTSLVADLYSGQSGSQPRYLVEFLDQLYFTADFRGVADDATGRELFRSNGTAAGTVLVADINIDPPPNDPGAPITQSSDPQELTVSGSRLFFSADGGVARGDDGRELWATDGTSVSLVSDIRSGSNDSSPTNLTDVNGVLYFSANNGSSGFEPFRSEGTSATTSLVANINGGNASSNPSGFMQAGSLVYFSAFDSDTGVELYVTDGTSAGTSLVSDLQAGISPSDPVPLGVVSGDRILVAATGNGTQDRELWMAGGAISGLAQVLDMNPGEFFGSFPSDLIPNGSAYLFVGNDGLSGRELYQLEEFDAEVEEVIIDDGSSQRSTISQVQVIFNTVVDLSGDPFDFVNSTTGESVVDVPLVTQDQGKTIVTFSFNEGASVNNAGLLRDGRYVLTVLASQVTSLGIALDGDGDGNVGDNYVIGAEEADGFYRKYGDGNGNGTVDLMDFGDFRRTFGESPESDAWNRIYDDEGDGTIGVEDFAEFRRNFGT
jgi:ELWxxDGT repeat protein